MMAQQTVIDHPQSITLSDFDPEETGGSKRKEADAQLAKLAERMRRQQDLLYGAARQSVLIVLQGMDTAGKDGTISHVMASVNPTGCQVWSFKVPSVEEAGHDFLWRVHQRTPMRGIMAIFNRSHYEDVLVARVHHLVPKDVWETRYEQINHFEQMLAQNDTIILKFFLHISKEEQEQRLLAREDDLDKSWKLSVADWKEREYWHDYQEAYADAVGRCGTKWAPWHIVPANKKWYRNLHIARTIVETLEPYEKRWNDELMARGKQELAALQAAHVHDEQAQPKQSS
jgi:PPK2 family polyphosphate:nucleotide phosphotransferase